MAFLDLETTLNDRYLILSVLGMGSFGIVYEALDLDSAGDFLRVAVKEAPMQGITDFERQADIRGALVHPAIPKVSDYFSIDETAKAYLVTDFIEGRDLEAALGESVAHLTEARVLDWGIQLCDVLGYLHTHPLHPVIFRDMKPNNVMMHKSGRLFLVDFGLARAYPPGYFENPKPEFAHYQKGLTLGTEGYSPPEQYDGIATPQSDIYALGATLYHLITKRDPRDAPPHTFSEHPIQDHNPHVSEEFEVILTRATQKELQDRYPSAAEMQTDLEILAAKVELKNNSNS